MNLETIFSNLGIFSLTSGQLVMLVVGLLILYLAINKKGEHGSYAVHPWFNYALHQGGKNQMIDSLSYL